MKIILLRDIRGVGKRGDVKDVSDGYARNFLILKGFAKPATDASIKMIKDLRLRREEKENILRAKLTKLSKRLSSEPLEIFVSAGEKGKLFASINGDKILDELVKKYNETELLEKAKVKIDRPFKDIGEYAVAIDFGLGVVGEIKLLVQSSHNETNRQI
jgi:large subunit ribosomal protein L9